MLSFLSNSISFFLFLSLPILSENIVFLFVLVDALRMLSVLVFLWHPAHFDAIKMHAVHAVIDDMATWLQRAESSSKRRTCRGLVTQSRTSLGPLGLWPCVLILCAYKSVKDVCWGGWLPLHGLLLLHAWLPGDLLPDSTAWHGEDSSFTNQDHKLNQS